MGRSSKSQSSYLGSGKATHSPGTQYVERKSNPDYRSKTSVNSSRSNRNNPPPKPKHLKRRRCCCLCISFTCVFLFSFIAGAAGFWFYDQFINVPEIEKSKDCGKPIFDQSILAIMASEALKEDHVPVITSEEPFEEMGAYEKGEHKGVDYNYVYSYRKSPSNVPIKTYTKFNNLKPEEVVELYVRNEIFILWSKYEDRQVLDNEEALNTHTKGSLESPTTTKDIFKRIMVGTLEIIFESFTEIVIYKGQRVFIGCQQALGPYSDTLVPKADMERIYEKLFCYVISGNKDGGTNLFTSNWEIGTMAIPNFVLGHNGKVSAAIQTVMGEMWEVAENVREKKLKDDNGAVLEFNQPNLFDKSVVPDNMLREITDDMINQKSEATLAYELCKSNEPAKPPPPPSSFETFIDTMFAAVVLCDNTFFLSCFDVTLQYRVPGLNS